MYICASNLDASLETNKDKKCILLQIPTIWQNLGLVPSFLIRCRLCNMYKIKTKCIWSKFPQSNKSMNGLAGNLLLWVQSPTSSFLTLGCIFPAFKENSGLENWFFLEGRSTQLTHIATIGINSIICQILTAPPITLTAPSIITLTAPSIVTRTTPHITPAWECSSPDHALYSILYPILVPTPLQILIHTLLQILIILEFRIVTLKRIAATTLDLDHH